MLTSQIIIKDGVTTPVKPELFEETCEHALAEAIESARHKVADNVNQGDYSSALQTIAKLREPVDDFFDGVMVMTDEEKLKTNRLALLTQVAAMFVDIADFTRIAA